MKNPDVIIPLWGCLMVCLSVVKSFKHMVSISEHLIWEKTDGAIQDSKKMDHKMIQHLQENIHFHLFMTGKLYEDR